MGQREGDCKGNLMAKEIVFESGDCSVELAQGRVC